MVGLALEVALHKLNINAGLTPVQQKQRRFVLDKETGMKEEVDKLLRQVSFEKSSIRPGWPMW